MACRFPGADDISAFWRLLEAGGNAVREGAPGSGIGRIGAMFPDDTGQIDACRFGAYLDLDVIDRFDAAFFRISPVEAHLLDPQQRLILETQLARPRGRRVIDPDELKDTPHRRVCRDQQQRLPGADPGGEREHGGPPNPPPVSMRSPARPSTPRSGRVAFALGLGGPAMAVDTACSSSLVATHQGGRRPATGRRGPRRLRAGVNVILSGRLLE